MLFTTNSIHNFTDTPIIITNSNCVFFFLQHSLSYPKNLLSLAPINHINAIEILRFMHIFHIYFCSSYIAELRTIFWTKIIPPSHCECVCVMRRINNWGPAKLGSPTTVNDHIYLIQLNTKHQTSTNIN